MLRKLKKVLLFIALSVLMGVVLCGCSSDGDGASSDGGDVDAYIKNGGYSVAYILNETDFQSLKKDVESGSSVKKWKDNYVSATELNVGETYYAVGYTVAETNDRSAVKFERGGGFDFSDEKSGELYLGAVYESYIPIGSHKPSIERTSDPGDYYLHYEVTVPEGGRKAEICTYIMFTPHDDMRINLTYGMNATRYEHDPSYGGAFERKVELTLDCYHANKVDLVDMKVSFLAGGNYVDGKYDESKLQDTVDARIGETYYTVVTGKLKPRFSQSTGEAVSLDVAVFPTSGVSATLETASSGTYTEKTRGGAKFITVEFRLPENAEEEKEFTLIVKITPTAVGSVFTDLTFFSESKISVVGENRVVNVSTEVTDNR